MRLSWLFYNLLNNNNYSFAAKRLYIYPMQVGQTFVFMLLMGLSGCARRPAAAYQPLTTDAAAAPVAPRLLFLSGRLTAAPTGTRLEVLHLKAVPGDLKLPNTDADTPAFLRVSQLDRQDQPLAQLRVAHPLRRSVEHVGDDQRTFQRSDVVLPTAEFFVRLALQPAATTLRVEEIIDGKTNTLANLSIPPKS